MTTLERAVSSARPTTPTVGHVSLALALTAYERWLREPGSSVTDLLGQALESLRDFSRDLI